MLGETQRPGRPTGLAPTIFSAIQDTLAWQAMLQIKADNLNYNCILFTCFHSFKNDKRPKKEQGEKYFLLESGSTVP
jgi:hypothetical protein